MKLTMAVRFASLYADALVRSRPDDKTAIEMLREDDVEKLRANTKELTRLVLDLRTVPADLGLSAPDHPPTGRRRRWHHQLPSRCDYSETAKDVSCANAYIDN
jgi:hypothetical protein